VNVQSGQLSPVLYANFLLLNEHGATTSVGIRRRRFLGLIGKEIIEQGPLQIDFGGQRKLSNGDMQLDRA
jgi:hypothetical protein